MSKLTLEDLKNLKENDVIFSINPYGHGNNSQNRVGIVTYVVSSVDEEGKLNGYTSSSTYEGAYVNTYDYIQDMVRSIKGVFDNLTEALEYLELVHTGNFSQQVDDLHHSLK